MISIKQISINDDMVSQSIQAAISKISHIHRLSGLTAIYFQGFPAKMET